MKKRNACITLLIGLLAATHARGQGVEDTVLPDPQQMARIEASVDRAIAYLAQQQREDGTWPQGINGRGGNNGINAMCLLAMLGRGHAPNRGPYKMVVDRGVRFILSTQDTKGLYASPAPSHGPMYEHALATLAMIEAYGFIPRMEMRRSVQRAVDLIVRSQNGEGGWRYQPNSTDADLSVTVMQVVALHAAMNARLNVPQETIDKALAYVKRCAMPEGGFAYQPGQGAKPAQTAAGALCMQLLGAYDDPAVAKALKYLQDRDYNSNIDPYFYYMSYYAMQAHFQAGGQQWAIWHPRVSKFLLATQNENGSWPGYGEQNLNGQEASCYSTAMGAMCMEVYMHYLPAYQR
ncbi:MAG: prenyltransferase [Planctomycetes bacterium]|nr:prenyltransferase [Planctomycetota bacterium]